MEDPAQPTTTRSVAAVTDVAYHLPERTLTNDDIARDHPEWSVEKIFEKTGIATRHIAAEDETALDLAVAAAGKLFARGRANPDDIDLLLFCTQTPDYALPTSACIAQDRLGLPKTCAAFDINLGCSGFVYALSVAKAMLESGQANRALVLTGETYSKWIAPDDKSVKTIFGDAGAATLVERVDRSDGDEAIGPFVFGTDGGGFDRLIVPGSGARSPQAPTDERIRDKTTPGCLYMDGPNIFTFTIRTVPKTVKALLAKAEASLDDLDLVVFHQANTYMLEHLRKSCRIPAEKFVYALEHYGNTVSNTIPIALRDSLDAGNLVHGMRVALVGFGVGFSWAAGLIRYMGD